MTDRVVVIGDIAVDVVARFAGPLNAGSDTPARISMSGGGSAANVACWLATLGGCDVVFAGRVGDDASGRSGVDAMGALGVTMRVAVDAACATGAVVVLVNDAGERTMLPDRGANAALAPSDLPDDLFVAGSHLHVSGYVLLDDSSRPAGIAALARARAAGMTTSIDPSSAAPLREVGVERFVDWTRGADLCLANLDEATVLSGADAATEPAELARRLAQSAYGEVVVKIGPGGAVWSDGREVVAIDAVVVDVVDTTGAGDAFAAGFLSGWTADQTPRDCLERGARVAAQAVAVVGGRPPTHG